MDEELWENMVMVPLFAQLLGVVTAESIIIAANPNVAFTMNRVNKRAFIRGCIFTQPKNTTTTGGKRPGIIVFIPVQALIFFLIQAL
jgi:ABC-type hemin transport system substrate-binding protein